MKVGGWGLGEKGESRALLGLDCVSILIINHYCTITCYTRRTYYGSMCCSKRVKHTHTYTIVARTQVSIAFYIHPTLFS